MLLTVALMMIAVGFVLVLVGVLLIMLGAVRRSEGETKGAFVFLIGPIPIIGATDKETLKIAALLTVAALVIVVLLAVIWWL